MVRENTLYLLIAKVENDVTFFLKTLPIEEKDFFCQAIFVLVFNSLWILESICLAAEP